MTTLEKKLICDLRDHKISPIEFQAKFQLEEYYSNKYFAAQVNDAIEREDREELELLIFLLWPLYRDHDYIDTLNNLLTEPLHTRHQEIARKLQKLKSPSTVPFVKKALETNFDYLDYTCSESDVLAKWFSWILAEIGTKEAIDLLEEYSNSSDDGVRNEMLYRLEKLKVKNRKTV